MYNGYKDINLLTALLTNYLMHAKFIIYTLRNACVHDLTSTKNTLVNNATVK